jgi:hypothetical protein
MGRGEADDEIWILAVELIEDLSGNLTDGVSRERMLGERGGEAVHQWRA